MILMSHRQLAPTKKPVPLLSRRKLPKEDMTVCVAAICENGRKIVVATDWRLSFAGVASDSAPGKMLWFGDWLFMYAGVPGQTNLIFEELRFKGDHLERNSINDRVLEAYRKAKAKFCAHAVLSPYDLTMEEFKSEGLKMFGRSVFGRLSDAIERQGQYFNEHLLIAGFGDKENAAHLFQIGSETSSPTLGGMGTIGSGFEVAMSVLVNLKQARHSSLGDTIYAVAAAKFAAEMTEDDSVGNKTTMYVAWRRTDDDPPDRPPGLFIDGGQLKALRLVWEEHGRPQIPDAAFPPLWEIVKRIKVVKPGIGTPMEVGDLRLSLTARAYLEQAAAEGATPSDSQKSEDQQ